MFIPYLHLAKPIIFFFRLVRMVCLLPQTWVDNGDCYVHFLVSCLGPYFMLGILVYREGWKAASFLKNFLHGKSEWFGLDMTPRIIPLQTPARK